MATLQVHVTDFAPVGTNNVSTRSNADGTLTLVLPSSVVTGAIGAQTLKFPASRDLSVGVASYTPAGSTELKGVTPNSGAGKKLLVFYSTVMDASASGAAIAKSLVETFRGQRVRAVALHAVSEQVVDIVAQHAGASSSASPPSLVANPREGAVVEGLVEGTLPNALPLEHIASSGWFTFVWCEETGTTAVIAADGTRPELCNASLAKLTTFETCARATSAVFGILNGIRFMRKRLPFSATTVSNLLRRSCDSTGTTRASLHVCLDSSNGNIEETYHTVRGLENIVNHIGFVSGFYTRDMEADAWRLQADAVALEKQLEVVKAAYKYVPVIVGTQSDSLEAEEKAAISQKKHKLEEARRREQKERMKQVHERIEKQRLLDAETIATLQQKLANLSAKGTELATDLEAEEQAMASSDIEAVLAKSQKRLERLRQENDDLARQKDTWMGKKFRMQSQAGVEYNTSASALYPAATNEEKTSQRRKQNVENVYRAQARDAFVRYIEYLDRRVVAYMARVQLLHANRVSEQQQRFQSVRDSIAGLHPVLSRVFPRNGTGSGSSSAGARMSKTLEKVHQKLSQHFDGEYAFFNGEVQRLRHFDADFDVYKVKLNVVGLGGIVKTMRNVDAVYTVAMNCGGSVVQPSPIPADASGVVKWNHPFTFTVALSRRAAMQSTARRNVVLTVLEMKRVNGELHAHDAVPFQMDVAQLVREPRTYLARVHNLNLEIEIGATKLQPDDHESSTATQRASHLGTALRKPQRAAEERRNPFCHLGYRPAAGPSWEIPVAPPPSTTSSSSSAKKDSSSSTRKK